MKKIYQVIEKLRLISETLFDQRNNFTEDDRSDLSNVLETLNEIISPVQDVHETALSPLGSTISCRGIPR